MSADAIVFLALLAALGAGLMAGMFFAFSVFIMRALDEIGPEAGIRAMQAINRTVITPAFIGVFFGTGILGLGLIGAWAGGLAGTGGPLSAAGAAVYLGGSIGVTVVKNVPLNNALAAADPATDTGRAVWTGYLTRWTRWNHVRTLACAAACVLFILAMRGG